MRGLLLACRRDVVALLETAEEYLRIGTEGHQTGNQQADGSVAQVLVGQAPGATTHAAARQRGSSPGTWGVFALAMLSLPRGLVASAA